MPGDGLALQESDRVPDGDGRAGNSGGLSGGLGDRKTAGSQPAALNKTDYGLSVEGQNGGTTLAESYRMAEEKDVRSRGGFFQLGGFVGKDFAGGAVLLRGLKRLRILLPPWMQRQGENMLAEESRVRRQRQKGYLVLARERIWRRSKYGDVVFLVDGNHFGPKKLRRAIGAADENVGLSAVAKGLQNMRDGKDVTLFVDEEAVAKEAVVVAPRGWGLIQLINDGADRGRERGFFSGRLRRDNGPQAAEKTGKERP